MQTRIKAIYPYLDQFKVTEPFGYACKGIPGLDIIINGKSGKMMKEKFIFLTRSAGLRLPLKHFVLCLEEDISEDSLPWVELPLFILYLSLAEVLPIHHLEDCLCSGRVYASGGLHSLLYPENFLTFLESSHAEDKILASSKLNTTHRLFPLEMLFEQLPYFSFNQEAAVTLKEKMRRQVTIR